LPLLELLEKMCQVSQRVVTRGFRTFTGRPDITVGMAACVQTLRNFTSIHPHGGSFDILRGSAPPGTALDAAYRRGIAPELPDEARKDVDALPGKQFQVHLDVGRMDPPVKNFIGGDQGG